MWWKNTRKRFVEPITIICNLCSSSEFIQNSSVQQPSSDNLTSRNDNMNAYYLNSVHANKETTTNDIPVNDNYIYEIRNKPITELTVADIFKINTLTIAPLKSQLTAIQDKLMNMQKCLNNIDSEKRNKNVIVMGVPEEDKELDGNISLKSDYEK